MTQPSLRQATPGSSMRNVATTVGVAALAVFAGMRLPSCEEKTASTEEELVAFADKLATQLSEGHYRGVHNERGPVEAKLFSSAVARFDQHRAAAMRGEPQSVKAVADVIRDLALLQESDITRLERMLTMLASQVRGLPDRVEDLNTFDSYLKKLSEDRVIAVRAQRYLAPILAKYGAIDTTSDAVLIPKEQIGSTNKLIETALKAAALAPDQLALIRFGETLGDIRSELEQVVAGKIPVTQRAVEQASALIVSAPVVVQVAFDSLVDEQSRISGSRGPLSRAYVEGIWSRTGVLAERYSELSRLLKEAEPLMQALAVDSSAIQVLAQWP